MAAMSSAANLTKEIDDPAVKADASFLPAVAATVKNASAGAAAFAMANPVSAAAYTAAGVGAVVAVVPAIVYSPALAVAGFSPGGIVKGSIAAGTQSKIGNVVAGSLFATLQSASAKGYGVAAVSTRVSAVSCAASTLVAGTAWLIGKGADK